MRRASDRGSATIAAVFAAACFALLAAQMARTSRSDIQSVNAGVVHARLAAAADAGLALAVAGLTADSLNTRWDIDRTPHTIDFDTAELTIVIEDERGKIPLNTITAPQVETLLRRAGAEPGAVPGVVESFLDYRDPNRSRTPGPPPRAGSGPVSQRNGGFRTLEELALIPGMTPALYAAIVPSVSVNAGDAPFDARTATPLALDVMMGAMAGTQSIERERELQGERTALQVGPPVSLIGRALTVRVEASDPTGARVDKATIIELTGQPAKPYVVRQQGAGYA